MKIEIKAMAWRVLLALLATAPWSTGVVGLHGVGVDVPGAVLVGETVTLGCRWTLDDEEALYSVKWYRGREEFYRYIPKELPHTRVFPLGGIDVDISLSGARRVVLRGATPALAGRYRCEVSADAPTFHTEIRSAPLLVVEPPEWSPQLVSERAWYGVGHTLRATCVTPASNPPANITVMLNGELLELESYANKIPEWFKWKRPSGESTTASPPLVDVEGAADVITDQDAQYLDVPGDSRDYDLRPQASALHQHLEIPEERLPAVGVVSFVVQSDSFVGGTLQLTCVANIYNVWAARDHLKFHSEQPEVASVLGVRNSASDGARGIIGGKLLFLSVLLLPSLR